MARTVRTDYYYYIYSNVENDMLWYSPSSDDKAKCDRNLLNCIEEARRILRRQPDADIEIDAHYCDMCGEYEDGDEGTFTVCLASELDQVEENIRKGMKK